MGEWRCGSQLSVSQWFVVFLLKNPEKEEVSLGKELEFALDLGLFFTRVEFCHPQHINAEATRTVHAHLLSPAVDNNLAHATFVILAHFHPPCNNGTANSTHIAKQQRKKTLRECSFLHPKNKKQTSHLLRHWWPRTELNPILPHTPPPQAFRLSQICSPLHLRYKVQQDSTDQNLCKLSSSPSFSRQQ